MHEVLKRTGRAFIGRLSACSASRRNMVMFGLLLVSSWVMTDIYHFNTVSELPIAVTDMDNTSVSRTIVRYLDASPFLAVVSDIPQSPDQVREMMIDGRIAASVLIPDGLSASIRKGSSAGDVVVSVDMANILVGRNVSNAVATVMGTVNAGIRIKTLQKTGESADSALARVVPALSEDNYSFNPAKSYAAYLVPGLMLFFLQVYMILLCLQVIRSDERRYEKAAGFAGLIVHGTVLGLLFLYVIMPRHELTVHSPLWLVTGLLALNFFSLVLIEIGIKTLFRGNIFTMQVSVFLGMLSLMLSGVTWPTDMFPMPLRLISYLLPFTPLAKGMRIVIHSPASLDDLSGPLLIFAGQMAFYVVVIAVVSLVVFAARRLIPRKEAA